MKSFFGKLLLLSGFLSLFTLSAGAEDFLPPWKVVNYPQYISLDLNGEPGEMMEKDFEHKGFKIRIEHVREDGTYGYVTTFHRLSAKDSKGATVFDLNLLDPSLGCRNSLEDLMGGVILDNPYNPIFYCAADDSDRNRYIVYHTADRTREIIQINPYEPPPSELKACSRVDVPLDQIVELGNFQFDLKTGRVLRSFPCLLADGSKFPNTNTGNSTLFDYEGLFIYMKEFKHYPFQRLTAITKDGLETKWSMDREIKIRQFIAKEGEDLIMNVGLKDLYGNGLSDLGTMRMNLKTGEIAWLLEGAGFYKSVDFNGRRLSLMTSKKNNLRLFDFDLLSGKVKWEADLQVPFLGGCQYIPYLIDSQYDNYCAHNFQSDVEITMKQVSQDRIKFRMLEPLNDYNKRTCVFDYEIDSTNGKVLFFDDRKECLKP